MKRTLEMVRNTGPNIRQSAALERIRKSIAERRKRQRDSLLRQIKIALNKQRGPLSGDLEDARKAREENLRLHENATVKYFKPSLWQRIKDSWARICLRYFD